MVRRRSPGDGREPRRSSARAVNAVMTETYWEIGRRIVEWEQDGRERAAYGDAMFKRLAMDLTKRFGRGFSRQNLQQMRQFYRAYPLEQICQTPSGKSGDPPRRAGRRRARSWWCRGGLASTYGRPSPLTRNERARSIARTASLASPESALSPG